MKYTHYILYGHPIRPEEVGVLAIPAAIIAVPILTGFLAGAVIMDADRYIRLRRLIRAREQSRTRYICGVLRSLGVSETTKNINLLRAA